MQKTQKTMNRIFSTAENIIKDPENWTQGAHQIRAERPENWKHDIVGAMALAAKRHCPGIVPYGFAYETVFHRMVDVVCAALGLYAPHIFQRRALLEKWNDNPSRTHEEVLEALGKGVQGAWILEVGW